jgi:hypothetical protein
LSYFAANYPNSSPCGEHVRRAKEIVGGGRYTAKVSNRIVTAF